MFEIVGLKVEIGSPFSTDGGVVFGAVDSIDAVPGAWVDRLLTRPPSRQGGAAQGRRPQPCSSTAEARTWRGEPAGAMPPRPLPLLAKHHQPGRTSLEANSYPRRET